MRAPPSKTETYIWTQNHNHLVCLRRRSYAGSVAPPHLTCFAEDRICSRRAQDWHAQVGGWKPLTSTAQASPPSGWLSGPEGSHQIQHRCDVAQTRTSASTWSKADMGAKNIIAFTISEHQPCSWVEEEKETAYYLRSMVPTLASGFVSLQHRKFSKILLCCCQKGLEMYVRRRPLFLSVPLEHRLGITL